jgi:hypothetical protein
MTWLDARVPEGLKHRGAVNARRNSARQPCVILP